MKSLPGRSIWPLPGSLASAPTPAYSPSSKSPQPFGFRRNTKSISTFHTCSSRTACSSPRYMHGSLLLISTVWTPLLQRDCSTFPSKSGTPVFLSHDHQHRSVAILSPCSVSREEVTEVGAGCSNRVVCVFVFQKPQGHLAEQWCPRMETSAWEAKEASTERK